MAIQTYTPLTNGSESSPPLSEVTTWHPFSILTPFFPSTQKFALIALNQPLCLPPSVYNLLWQNAHTHIGADGGANRVYRLNTKSASTSTSSTSSLESTTNREVGVDLPLDTIIGDLDSLTPKTRKYWEGRGTEIIHVPEQDSTDFTKAVTYIRSPPSPSNPEPALSNSHSNSNSKHSNPTTDIVVLGGLGGRVDQGLSVLHHLYMFQTSSSSPSPESTETTFTSTSIPSISTYSSGKIYLLSTSSITFLLLPGTHCICVKGSNPSIGIKLGKHIGIIPLLGPAIISTCGLEWDVQNWETRFGGQMSTSNWVREEWVEVRTDKGVLFTVDLEMSGSEEEDEGE